MVVVNGMSRYHLCMEALRRARRPPARATELIAQCQAALAQHHAYSRAHLEDMPEIRDWVWSG
jgi:xylulose-5-phosphate/fructose-6-phosphate phosphoketolase